MDVNEVRNEINMQWAYRNVVSLSEEFLTGITQVPAIVMEMDGTPTHSLTMHHSKPFQDNSHIPYACKNMFLSLSLSRPWFISHKRDIYK